MGVTHFILGTYTLAWRIRDILLRMEGSSYSHIWNLQRNACGTLLEKHLKQQLWLIFRLALHLTHSITAKYPLQRKWFIGAPPARGNL